MMAKTRMLSVEIVRNGQILMIHIVKFGGKDLLMIGCEMWEKEEHQG